MKKNVAKLYRINMPGNKEQEARKKPSITNYWFLSLLVLNSHFFLCAKQRKVQIFSGVLCIYSQHTGDEKKSEASTARRSSRWFCNFFKFHCTTITKNLKYWQHHPVFGYRYQNMSLLLLMQWYQNKTSLQTTHLFFWTSFLAVGLDSGSTLIAACAFLYNSSI